jgi:hypothetical protein
MGMIKSALSLSTWGERKRAGVRRDLYGLIIGNENIEGDDRG